MLEIQLGVKNNRLNVSDHGESFVPDHARWTENSFKWLYRSCLTDAANW